MTIEIADLAKNDGAFIKSCHKKVIDTKRFEFTTSNGRENNKFLILGWQCWF